MIIPRVIAALVFAAVAVVLTAGLSQGDAAPVETSGLATASYSLHPVEDSGVTGQLQIVEQAPGGTLLILTLVGIDEGRRYPAALYVGNCGPDRPVHLEREGLDVPALVCGEVGIGAVDGQP